MCHCPFPLLLFSTSLTLLLLFLFVRCGHFVWQNCVTLLPLIEICYEEKSSIKISFSALPAHQRYIRNSGGSSFYPFIYFYIAELWPSHDSYSHTYTVYTHSHFALPRRRKGTRWWRRVNRDFGETLFYADLITIRSRLCVFTVRAALTALYKKLKRGGGGDSNKIRVSNCHHHQQFSSSTLDAPNANCL